MLSSRVYPTSFFFLVVVLSRAVGQEKNSEFKHELPEGVELVDPKSLGLTDADLSKFLGNVKVLGGGQVGDTKTQILSVGFEGDENINFNDFHIPGLTDGNKTALPEKDKEIADIAFKRFKEFFQDPKKARQYDDKNNIQFPPPKGFEHFKNTPQAPQNNVQGRFQQQQHPPHFQIPMIQKPYTTPRTEIRQHFIQNQRPPHPQQQHHQQHHHQQQHPPQHHHRQQPPPPPQPHKQYITPFNQAQIQQQQQQVYHSQKPQPQSSNLEFGARIPVSPNPHLRPQQQQSQPVPQQYQHHQQNQGQFQFHRQHEQQRQHRLTIQQNHRHQQHQNHHQPQPQPQQQHNFQAPPPQQNIINHSPPQHQAAPQNYPEPNPPQLVPPPPPPPRPQQQQQHNQNQNFVQHSPPQPSRPQQHIQNQNFVAHPQPPPTRPQQHAQSQNVVPHSQPPPPPSPQPQEEFPASREQGRVVRNQLLQLNNNHIETSNNHGKLHSPSASTYHTTTNHLPAHSHQHASFQQPPQATATSHVYIQHGPKAKAIEQTSFHPKFQPPTRFAKDFTPLPPQATTARPHFEVTPSMALIPLSTNENAIKDPARTMQLRQYQRERALASNAHQSQAVLPLQAAPPTTPTTTPISITTSYPETHHQAEDQQHQFSPTNYHSGSQQLQQRPLNPKFTSNDNDNAISDNDDFSKSQQFSFQKQPQQHQLHLLQQRPPQQTQPQQQQQQQFHRPTQPAQTQPPVFYNQQHNSRPPRQGHGQGPPPPRFQFHVQHDLGRPPRFQMQPDPKGVLNTIRRKRGYRRLSNLFRMFRSRWDNRH